MARRGARVPAPAPPDPPSWPAVSVVLATREPTPRIVQRLQNLGELEYPARALQFVVALDATVAERQEAVQQALGSGVVVVHGGAAGKASALTAGVHAAAHELLLFVDTAQQFAPDALPLLVSAVLREGWGAATATLQPTSGDALMDRYWRRELAVRLGQASRHSVICVTGCAYVMRRQFWRDMPVGLICDDLWSTYSVVTGGARVAIVPGARVVDPRRFSREQELARRLRTMTGLLQFVLWFPGILSAHRNPMLIDFLLHKLVRPLTPLLLLVTGLATFGLLWRESPGLASVLTTAGASAGLASWILAGMGEGRLPRMARTGIFAGQLLFMPLKALAFAAAGRWDVWRPHH
ncbi:glycosyltransferase [Gemmatimonas sp.]|uniref:glycosyltransferase n=1 Tax=Gemmatimonas sp. TaxID=1962908 RepID=UPI0037C19CE7